MTILVIDDHLDDLKAMLELVFQDYQLEYAESGTEGLARLRSLRDVGCVLLDMIMPPELGEEDERRVGLAVLKRIISERPGLPVVMHTTIDDDVELVQEARDLGAYWYVAKSSSAHVLQERVRAAVAQYEKTKKVTAESRPKKRARVIGKSKAARDAEDLLRKFALTDETVLLLGEPGTGKELAARAIHDASPRKAARFMVVDCTQLKEPVEIQNLWGWARGAFTGADEPHEGAFETAGGGTVFLDEFGEVPLDQQSRLLRVVQEKEVCRLKEHTHRAVDVRIVAATNRDLEEEVKRGAFRRDLYDRIEGFSVKLPPLRGCREDIPDLIQHFLAEAAPAGTEPPSLSSEIVEKLKGYSWPGNVRELEKGIKRAVILADGKEISADHFGIDFDDPGAGLPADSPAALRIELRELGYDAFTDKNGRVVIKEVLAEAVKEFGGIKQAGEGLDLFRPGREEKDYNLLRSWCKRLGIRARG